MVRLECSNCGYESIVAPKDSATFVKQGISIGSWFWLLILIGVMLLLVCGEEIGLLITYMLE